MANFVVQVNVYWPGIGWTAQMANSRAIWAIRCHVIAIRQSSAQLSIINNWKCKSNTINKYIKIWHYNHWKPRSFGWKYRVQIISSEVNDNNLLPFLSFAIKMVKKESLSCPIYTYYLILYMFWFDTWRQRLQCFYHARLKKECFFLVHFNGIIEFKDIFKLKYHVTVWLLSILYNSSDTKWQRQVVKCIHYLWLRPYHLRDNI